MALAVLPRLHRRVDPRPGFYTPLGTIIKIIGLMFSWVLYKQKFKKNPKETLRCGHGGWG